MKKFLPILIMAVALLNGCCNSGGYYMPSYFVLSNKITLNDKTSYILSVSYKNTNKTESFTNLNSVPVKLPTDGPLFLYVKTTKKTDTINLMATTGIELISSEMSCGENYYKTKTDIDLVSATAKDVKINKINYRSNNALLGLDTLGYEILITQ